MAQSVCMFACSKNSYLKTLGHQVPSSVGWDTGGAICLDFLFFRLEVIWRKPGLLSWPVQVWSTILNWVVPDSTIQPHPHGSYHITLHLIMLRQASKDTFTALSQITLYARQTGSSSRHTERPRFLPWEFNTVASNKKLSQSISLASETMFISINLVIWFQTIFSRTLEAVAKQLTGLYFFLSFWYSIG